MEKKGGNRTSVYNDVIIDLLATGYVRSYFSSKWEKTKLPYGPPFAQGILGSITESGAPSFLGGMGMTALGLLLSSPNSQGARVQRWPIHLDEH